MERRKFVRKYLTFFSRVVDRHNGKMLGYLVDLSQTGAMLVGEATLQSGTRMLLRMDLPEDLCPQQQIDIQAMVVWNRPDSDPGFYRAGLEFVDLSLEDSTLISSLITNYGYPS